MSEDIPDSPRIPPPSAHQGSPSQQPRGGSLAMGILVGAVALYVFYVGAVMASGPYAGPPRGIAGPSAFIPIAVYLLLAILLAVRRRTSRFGAGLLIGLGMFTLLGGGICVGSLAQTGGLT